jgi:hypothetical protein
MRGRRSKPVGLAARIAELREAASAGQVVHAGKLYGLP